MDSVDVAFERLWSRSDVPETYLRLGRGQFLRRFREAVKRGSFVFNIQPENDFERALIDELSSLAERRPLPIKVPEPVSARTTDLAALTAERDRLRAELAATVARRDALEKQVEYQDRRATEAERRCAEYRATSEKLHAQLNREPQALLADLQDEE